MGNEQRGPTQKRLQENPTGEFIQSAEYVNFSSFTPEPATSTATNTSADSKPGTTPTQTTGPSVCRDPGLNNMATKLSKDANPESSEVDSEEPLYNVLVVPPDAPDLSGKLPQTLLQYDYISLKLAPLAPIASTIAIPSSGPLQKPASIANNLPTHTYTNLLQTITKPPTIQAQTAQQATAPSAKRRTSTTSAGASSANQYHSQGSLVKPPHAPFTTADIKKPPAAAQVCTNGGVDVDAAILESAKHAGVALEVALGDLAEEDSDALLCSADAELSLSTRIAKALVRKAGDVLKLECANAEARRAMAAEGLACTSGGQLRAKHVLPLDDADGISKAISKVC